jgi:hypothetical protein
VHGQTGDVGDEVSLDVGAAGDPVAVGRSCDPEKAIDAASATIAASPKTERRAFMSASFLSVG